jgi:hypothetical protein
MKDPAAVFLMAYATRLRNGPRKRASWEQPINTHQLTNAEARMAAALIEGLAGSIEAGLHLEDAPRDPTQSHD